MGMAISGGVKFTTNDIFEITQRLDAWRDVLKALTRSAMLDLYAQGAVRAIDDTLARGKPVADRRPMSIVYNEIMDAQREIKKTGYRNPEYDFDFEISIIPHAGEIYGMIRCEHREWVRKFKRTGLVKDFYWHDNEKPDSIRRGEWDARGEIWNTIFEKDSRPAAHGFNAELTVPLYQIKNVTPKEVAKRIMPFDQRLTRVARNIITDKRVWLDPEFIERNEKGEKGASAFIAASLRAIDWLKTDHAQVAFELEKASIAKLLPDPITEEML